MPDVPPELLTRVVERLKPEQVWLFGSRARGDARPGSDWDLLVVLPDDAPDESLDWGRVWDAVVPGLRIPTDIVPVRRSEYAQMRRFAGSICRSVALEGVQVYGEAVPPNPVSLGYLRAASEDLDAARRLFAPPVSRLGWYHLQQSAEKLAKAVLTARGEHATTEHRVAVLAGGLPQGDPWRTRLESLSSLDRFATTFRYPGTSGRLPAAPDPAEAERHLTALTELLAAAATEDGIGR